MFKALLVCLIAALSVFNVFALDADTRDVEDSYKSAAGELIDNIYDSTVNENKKEAMIDDFIAKNARKFSRIDDGVNGQAPSWMNGMSNEEIILDALLEPGLSEAQKTQLIEKLFNLVDFETSKEAVMAVTPGSQYLPVVAIKQDTNRTCAAATVQQTLKYINGTASAQSVYYNNSYPNGVGIGPGLQLVLDFLNSKQSRNSYVISEFTTESVFLSRLNYLYNANSPGVFTLKSTSADAWPYNTEGHFVNTYGWVDPDVSNSSVPKTYIFADPYYFSAYGFASEEGYSGGEFSLVLTVGKKLHGSVAKIGY